MGTPRYSVLLGTVTWAFLLCLLLPDLEKMHLDDLRSVVSFGRVNRFALTHAAARIKFNCNAILQNSCS